MIQKKSYYRSYCIIILIPAIILIFHNANYSLPENQEESSTLTKVSVKIIDNASGEVTPAMVSITGESNEVRLPPDGRIMKNPSTTKDFYTGINFENDKNWIGPIRKTTGIGDNEDRSYVYGDNPSVPYWQEPVMYQTSGDFTIELPEGRWRIAVDRGMEYVPVFEEFETTGINNVLEKEIDLKRWIDMPSIGWYSGDVHVHHPTTKPEHRKFLLNYAMATDLHLVNVLEMGHHEGTDFNQHGFGKEFRTCKEDYCLVSGQEDPRSNYGHIIGLNINKLVRDTTSYHFYDETFKGIHQQPEALVGFAHFAWNGGGILKGFPWMITWNEIDFVELLQFTKINKLSYYNYLNLGFKLSAAAGSDIPWGSNIGEVRTFVYTGGDLNIDDWFRGLKKGNSFVTNGPMLNFTVDEHLPGSEVDLNEGSITKIKAEVLSHPLICKPLSLTINGNKGVIFEEVNSKGHVNLDIEIDLKINQSQWLVATTKCENGAVAHTSPVYILVDDEPTWSKEKGSKVILQQLEMIEEIELELIPLKNQQDEGVLQRLDKAKKIYWALYNKMQQ